MSEHELDKQIRNSFGGIGKQRTLLSGTWASYLTGAIAFLGYAWVVVACWQEDTRIIATLRDDTRVEWMVSVDVALVGMGKALSVIASNAYERDYPSKRMMKADVDLVPDNAIQSRLWYELWQNGREGEYEALGGEWKAGDKR